MAGVGEEKARTSVWPVLRCWWLVVGKADEARGRVRDGVVASG
jgi:hypothetical protein